MDITLQAKKDLIIREAITEKTDKIKVLEVTDNYTSVSALIQLGTTDPKRAGMQNTKSIILWDEEAYKAIGQWTDTDVQNRLKTIL